MCGGGGREWRKKRKKKSSLGHSSVKPGLRPLGQIISHCTLYPSSLRGSRVPGRHLLGVLAPQSELCWLWSLQRGPAWLVECRGMPRGTARQPFLPQIPWRRLGTAAISHMLSCPSPLDKRIISDFSDFCVSELSA